MMAAAIVAVLVSPAPAEAATAQDTLKQPPFAPTDTSLLDPAVYSDAPLTVPASTGPTEEATLKGLLSDLLTLRFPNSPKTVNQGLAKFDSQSTKAIVSDPRLRAALVSLKATAGEPAINGVLTKFSQVRFGDTTQGAVAQVDAPPPGSDKPIITFSQRYEFEDFRLLASPTAHEALHQDSIQSTKEELIANSIK